MVLQRDGERVADAMVADLPALLQPGDLLVVNNTRVFAARLLGRREPSGGAVECLLLRRVEADVWEALMHPGQKLKPGARVVFEGAAGTLHGEVLERRFFGRRTIRLVDRRGRRCGRPHRCARPHAAAAVHQARRHTADRERYQTVYAAQRGSIAAPTAGSTSREEILDALAARGVERHEVTLHVGYGTFKPVRVDGGRGSRGRSRALRDQSRRRRRDQPRARRAAPGHRRRHHDDAGARGSRPSAAVARIEPARAEATTFIYPGFAFRSSTGC